MAVIIWDGDVAGNVSDRNGITGASDGVGTITLTGGTFLPPIGDTIRVINCDVLKSQGAFSSDVQGGIASHWEFLGKGTRPLLITSSAGVPAISDWAGFSLAGDATLTDRNGPTIRLEHVTAEYAGGGITGAVTGDGHVGLVMRNSTYKLSNGRHIDIACGGRAVIDVRYCQFIGCEPARNSLRAALRIQGVAASPAANRPIVLFEHNTVLWRTLRVAGFQPVFSIPDRATLVTKNNIIAAENTDGTQIHKILDAPGGNSIHTNDGYNILHEYDAGPIDLGDWTTHPTDQVLDPAFANAACATPDLAPDGSVGSPELWKADSTGDWHPGAVEPFNAGSLTPLSSVGTAAVYGERKQRIYTQTFGTSPARGRAIRMKLRSTDRQSRKLFAGIFVRHAEEEPK